MFEIVESTNGLTNAEGSSGSNIPEMASVPPLEGKVEGTSMAAETITHQERVQLVTALEKNLAGVVPEPTSRRDVLKNVLATLAGFTRLTRMTVQGIAATEAVNASALAADADNEAV